MTNSLVRFAMAGALAMGLALAQTPAPQAAAAPAKKVKPAGKLRHRLMKQLALSPTQKQQAKDIFKQAKTANQTVHADLKQNHDALTAAIKSNNAPQIDQLTQARASLQAKALSNRSQAMAKFYASLTPDQKTKADQIQQRVQKRAQRLKG